MNNDHKKLLSIVIPIYNEEENIHELWRRLQEVLNSINYDYEIIFVDDGSTDNSLFLLKEIREKETRVKIISYSRNFSHQIAITGGMEYASGEAVIVMDGDLQHPPEILPRLIEKWEEGYEVVSTIRENANNISLFKKYSAAIFYKLLNAMSDTKIDPNAPDFRLIDRKAVNTLNTMQERARFIRGLVNWIGFKQVFIKFTADKRYAGNTKYSLKKMNKFAFDGITAFSTAPLHIVTGLGITATTIPLIYSIYAIFLRLFTNIAVPGWTSILVAVVFFGGIQLITIGMIGEYISRIYDEVKGRPMYIVKETFGFAQYMKRSIINSDESNSYKRLR
ncbi:MAG: glycosyltransferase family 2 protein [Bacteroidetes bacterium]|nr:glycosyltransferase family 2 protein [Bacteroidota bacterium]